VRSFFPQAIRIFHVPDPYSDEALMRKVGQGVVEHAGLLFERYHGPLYGFFLQSTRDRHVSEDLVQEVFLRMLRYRSSYSEGRAFKPWIFQIARNALNDHFRKSVVLDDAPLPDLPSEDVDPMERLETTRRVRDALDHLTPEQRELLILTNVSDLSYAEVAQIFEISVNAARVRVFRAMQALREVYLKRNPVGS
jgi:RNA polymerase sigma-70 factor (ECF subfamily)